MKRIPEQAINYNYFRNKKSTSKLIEIFGLDSEAWYIKVNKWNGDDVHLINNSAFV